MSRRAVFLDRDGTLSVDVGYPGRWSQTRLFPRSAEAVRRLNEAGFVTVVVTNQSGVGRGYYSEDELRELHAGLAADLAGRGARIDAVYHCPHFDLSADPRFRGPCGCRKPATGLALRAAADLDLDLGRSYMVGDKAEDVRFGLAMGAVPVLVLTGYGLASRRRLEALGVAPAAVAADLGAAVDWILARELGAGR
jgi:D-glycero-D-manno-heptose 1,7-bisphosphate phosphatase